MRWLGWLVVASALLVAPGCATRAPVAPLGHVSEPQALRVRLRREPYGLRFDLRGAVYRLADAHRVVGETREATTSFNRMLADTLRRAGYEVTEDGPCDVHVVRDLYFEAEQRERRHGNLSLGEIVRVVFHVYDTRGHEIDRFDFEAAENPKTPEGIAVDLVNAMLHSPKVGSYAATRKTLLPLDVPAVGEAAAPAAGAND